MLQPVATLDAPGLAEYRDIAHPDRLIARRVFVAEGRLVVERLVTRGTHQVRSLLLSTAAAAAMDAVVRRLPSAVPVYVAPQDVMNGVVGFNIHRGCLALAERPASRPLEPSDLAAAGRVLVLEGVNNPDNVGSLFRAAAALGAELVVLGPGCGDPLYRKAIRTSMAATLLLPYRVAAPWPDALALFRQEGVAIVACTPAPDAPSLYETRLPARAAVLVGAEGPGLSRSALTYSDVRVRIPMHGQTNSLNVATAAAIVLSALDARDRR